MMTGDQILTTIHLGKLVLAQRKTLKLTQIKAAGVCDVGIRFLSELENGKATAELGKVLQVMQGLGLYISIQSRQSRQSCHERRFSYTPQYNTRQKSHMANIINEQKHVAIPLPQ